jgi:MinD-like ATPase involved in chromosome partitioning or flagellar assembly
MSDLELLTPNLRSKEFTIVSGDAAMGRLSRRFNIDEKNVVDGFRDFVSSMSDTTQRFKSTH